MFSSKAFGLKNILTYHFSLLRLLPIFVNIVKFSLSIHHLVCILCVVCFPLVLNPYFLACASRFADFRLFLYFAYCFFACSRLLFCLLLGSFFGSTASSLMLLEIFVVSV